MLGAVAVGAVSTFSLGCPPGATVTSAIVVYRRSGRGRRISNFAKRVNANKLFMTEDLAQNSPAHPGDNSKVVMITLSAAKYNQFFIPGRTVVDLRDF